MFWKISVGDSNLCRSAASTSDNLCRSAASTSDNLCRSTASTSDNLCRSTASTSDNLCRSATSTSDNLCRSVASTAHICSRLDCAQPLQKRGLNYAQTKTFMFLLISLTRKVLKIKNPAIATNSKSFFFYVNYALQYSKKEKEKEKMFNQIKSI